MAKKKAPSIARRTVSIPPELDKRMTRFTDVNWSSVAKTAFIQKLETLEKKEIPIMSKALERLRASKVKHESQMFQDGFEVGQKWAQDEAQFHELQRLDTAKRQSGSEWELLFTQSNVDEAYSASDFIHRVIMDYDQPDPTESKEFFQEFLEISEEQELDGEFIRGFVEGAIHVYKQV